MLNYTSSPLGELPRAYRCAELRLHSPPLSHRHLPGHHSFSYRPFFLRCYRYNPGPAGVPNYVMHSSGSPSNPPSFHPSISAMVVDAPMTPPTSPLPPESNSEPPQSLDTPTVPSQCGPTLASQFPHPLSSLDQIMQLQQLQLYEDETRREDGGETLTKENCQSAEMPQPPQRSLEDEDIHVQGSEGLKLTDFDVVETLGGLLPPPV